MKNILITGGNGQLGSSFKEIEKKHSNWKLHFYTKSELDITRKNKVDEIFKVNKFEFVINCAAYTNVNKADEEFKLAHNINVDGVKNLAEISAKYSSKFIHISTDYVFDGKKLSPYDECDSTNPINQYGLSKLKGEEFLLNSYDDNCLIIRTSSVFSPYGTNFVKTMLDLFSKKDQITVVSDQFSSPTYAPDLANAIMQIIYLFENKNFKTQVYHFSNSGSISWLEFALFIKNYVGSSCQIHPVTLKDFDSKVKRPQFTAFNNSKIVNDFNIKLIPWEISLTECLNKILMKS